MKHQSINYIKILYSYIYNYIHQYNKHNLNFSIIIEMEIERIQVKKEAESPIKSMRTFSLAILNQKPTTTETSEGVNKPDKTMLSK